MYHVYGSATFFQTGTNRIENFFILLCDNFEHVKHLKVTHNMLMVFAVSMCELDYNFLIVKLPILNFTVTEIHEIVIKLAHAH